MENECGKFRLVQNFLVEKKMSVGKKAESSAFDTLSIAKTREILNWQCH